MNKNVVLAQLAALRTQIEALHASVVAVLETVSDGELKGECSHPQESRIDMSAMGVEKWQCRDCGHVFERPFAQQPEE